MLCGKEAEATSAAPICNQPARPCPPQPQHCLQSPVSNNRVLCYVYFAKLTPHRNVRCAKVHGVKRASIKMTRGSSVVVQVGGRRQGRYIRARERIRCRGRKAAPPAQSQLILPCSSSVSPNLDPAVPRATATSISFRLIISTKSYN